MLRLWATTLAIFVSLACSSAYAGAYAGALHYRHNHATQDVGHLLQSWHWAQNILQAVMMMSADKDWMADSSQCAASVHNTLERLADEYTDLQVGTVLSSACDHMNIYEDFGGHTKACRPIFGDLAEEFEGEKNYASWCEQAASMIASDTVAHHGTKKEMVEEAKAELAAAESKHARGEAIGEDLKKVKEMVHEAEDAESREDKDEESDDDEDIQVGQARFGSGENNEKPKEAGKADKKVEIIPVGDIPFGSKPKADVLTKGSVSETNAMVDQIEKAQTAEEKRSAFRALTRLRGAMTTSYDSMASKHMQNIDEYNSQHAWRKEHNVNHLASEEADVSKWAYPGNELIKK